MRRLLALLLALLALTVAGCTTDHSGQSGQTIQRFAPADRKTAPMLSGELVGGGRFDLAQHAGDVIVVNFWASWCGECVVEADDLEGTFQATKADKVTFLGVSIRDQRDDAKRFVVGRASYPSVFDPQGRLALLFSVPLTSIPATVIIDRQGRIAAIARGAVLRTDLESVVTQLATEPAP
jgi:peroxiredoxin/predicted small secreted protein